MKEETLQHEFIDLYMHGDLNLDMELHSHIHEKSPSFVFSDITLLKNLVDAHDRSAAAAFPESVSLQVAASQLEQQEFSLDMQKLTRDKNVYDVWRAKEIDIEARQYLSKLHRKQSRAQAGRDAAATFITDGNPNQRMHLLVEDGSLLTNIDNVLAAISRQHSLSDLPSAVFNIVLLNWAAPSVHTSDSQRIQVDVCVRRY